MEIFLSYAAASNVTVIDRYLWNGRGCSVKQHVFTLMRSFGLFANSKKTPLNCPVNKTILNAMQFWL